MPQYEHWTQEGAAHILLAAAGTFKPKLEGYTLCCVLEASSWEEAQVKCREHLQALHFPRREDIFPGQGPPLEGRKWFGQDQNFYGEQHAG